MMNVLVLVAVAWGALYIFGNREGGEGGGGGGGSLVSTEAVYVAGKYTVYARVGEGGAVLSYFIGYSTTGSPITVGTVGQYAYVYTPDELADAKERADILNAGSGDAVKPPTDDGADELPDGYGGYGYGDLTGGSWGGQSGNPFDSGSGW